MTGEELEKIRKELGLTRRELAEFLGVTVTTVYRWERGIHPIPKPVEILTQHIVAERPKPPI